MKPTVIVVDNDSLTDAFDHIEGMSDLNSPERKVIVKVGISILKLVSVRL